MKRIAGIALAALAAATAAGAVEIDRVIVRQQWPWSIDVKVDYSITGVTSPVDVRVQFFDGATEITPTGSPSAIKGELYGITASGEKSFRFNPKEVFGADRTAMFDFKVRLTPAASAANIDEVIYRIVDITKIRQGRAAFLTDITRREILNGDYGSYETDYGRIGPGFNTQLDDVLIWTGVSFHWALSPVWADQRWMMEPS